MKNNFHGDDFKIVFNRVRWEKKIEKKSFISVKFLFWGTGTTSNSFLGQISHRRAEKMKNSWHQRSARHFPLDGCERNAFLSAGPAHAILTLCERSRGAIQLHRQLGAGRQEKNSFRQTPCIIVRHECGRLIVETVDLWYDPARCGSHAAALAQCIRNQSERVTDAWWCALEDVQINCCHWFCLMDSH